MRISRRYNDAHKLSFAPLEAGLLTHIVLRKTVHPTPSSANDDCEGPRAHPVFAETAFCPRLTTQGTKSNRLRDYKLPLIHVCAFIMKVVANIENHHRQSIRRGPLSNHETERRYL
jgi:hypothetical protein